MNLPKVPKGRALKKVNGGKYALKETVEWLKKGSFNGYILQRLGASEALMFVKKGEPLNVFHSLFKTGETSFVQMLEDSTLPDATLEVHSLSKEQLRDCAERFSHMDESKVDPIYLNYDIDLVRLKRRELEKVVTRHQKSAVPVLQDPAPMQPSEQPVIENSTMNDASERIKELSEQVVQSGPLGTRVVENEPSEPHVENSPKCARKVRLRVVKTPQKEHTTEEKLDAPHTTDSNKPFVDLEMEVGSGGNSVENSSASEPTPTVENNDEKMAKPAEEELSSEERAEIDRQINEIFDRLQAPIKLPLINDEVSPEAASEQSDSKEENKSYENQSKPSSEPVVEMQACPSDECNHKPQNADEHVLGPIPPVEESPPHELALSYDDNRSEQPVQASVPSTVEANSDFLQSSLTSQDAQVNMHVNENKDDVSRQEGSKYENSNGEQKGEITTNHEIQTPKSVPDAAELANILGIDGEWAKEMLSNVDPSIARDLLNGVLPSAFEKESSLAKQRAMLDEKEAMLKRDEQSLEESKKELERARASLEDKQKQLSERELQLITRSKELELRAKDAEERMNELHAKEAQLQSRLAKLEAERSEYMKSLCDDKAKEEELNEIHAEINRCFAELDEKDHMLKESERLLELECAELEGKMNALADRENQLSEEKKAFSERIVEQERRESRFQAMKADFEADWDRAMAEQRAKEKQLDEKWMKFLKEEAGIKALKVKLDEQSNKLKVDEKRLQESKEEFERLCTKERESVALEREELSRESKNVEESMRILEKQEAKLRHLEKSLNIRATKLDAREGELKGLEASLSSSRSELDERESKLRLEEESLARSREEFDASRKKYEEELASSKKALEKKENELRARESLVAKREGKFENWEEELTHMKGMLESEKASLEDRKSALEALIFEEGEKMRAKESALEEIKRELESKERTIMSKGLELQELAKECASKEESLIAREKALAMPACELTSRSALEEERAKREAAERRLGELEMQLAKTKAELDSKAVGEGEDKDEMLAGLGLQHMGKSKKVRIKKAKSGDVGQEQQLMHEMKDRIKEIDELKRLFMQAVEPQKKRPESLTERLAYQPKIPKMIVRPREELEILARTYPQEVLDFYMRDGGSVMLLKGTLGSGRTRYALQFMEDWSKPEMRYYFTTRKSEDEEHKAFPWLEDAETRANAFFSQEDLAESIIEEADALHEKGERAIFVFNRYDRFCEKRKLDPNAFLELLRIEVAQKHGVAIVCVLDSVDNMPMDELADGVMLFKTHMRDTDTEFLGQLELKDLEEIEIKMNKYMYNLKEGRFTLLKGVGYHQIA